MITIGFKPKDSEEVLTTEGHLINGSLIHMRCHLTHEVTFVLANGDELDRIIGTWNNVPRNVKSPSMYWEAPWAGLIAKNMI
jgi:hypothetical protein